MSDILQTRTYPSGHQLEIARGDITTESLDAIVNAANAQLAHGGGVAAVIARKGGPSIDRQSRAWVQTHGPVTHEKPAYTDGGDLPARYVIHAVGPIWGSGDEDAKLSAAVQGSLARADELGLGSIALPAISTGIFGFPKERAARVMLRAIGAYFSRVPESRVRTVRIVLYDQPTVATFISVFNRTGDAPPLATTGQP